MRSKIASEYCKGIVVPWQHHQENSSCVECLVRLICLAGVASFPVRNIFFLFFGHKFQGVRIFPVFNLYYILSESQPRQNCVTVPNHSDIYSCLFLYKLECNFISMMISIFIYKDRFKRVKRPIVMKIGGNKTFPKDRNQMSTS